MESLKNLAKIRGGSHRVSSSSRCALVVVCLVLSASCFGQVRIVAGRPGTFIDISNTGTPLNLAGDDEVEIHTTIGNIFFPAGRVIVGNNGGIGFNPPFDTNLGPVPGPLPNANAFGGATSLLPYWSDIGNHVGNVYWQEIGNKLIVQWHNKRFENAPTLPSVTFQCQVLGGPEACEFAQFIYLSIEAPPAFGGDNSSIGLQLDSVGVTAQWSLFIPSAVSNGTVLSVVCDTGCRADFNGDGFSNGEDFDLFVAAFEAGDFSADFNGDTFVDGEDFDAYIEAFQLGC